MIYWLVAPVAIFVVVFLVIQVVGHLLSAPRYRGPKSDHFDGKNFINPGNVKAQSLGAVLKWLRTRQPGRWIPHRHDAPGKKPDETILEGARITFINHTTFLIQTSGMNILTDPVYSERVSPFSFAGPKRMRPPGIRFEDLPKIDLVLLSHNHYDHLDEATVHLLKKTFNPLFIVPLGVAAFLGKMGITRVQELDWWQEFSIASFHVSSVPAQHFSGRGFFDRDQTLWCGYVFKSKTVSVCFVGDTGYNAHTFKDISDRIGDIDLAIIPIGAYKPIWFMSPVHCSPDEAVKIHLDLKARLSIASHFGTFPLGDDGQTEPVQELKVAKEKRNVPIQDFITLKEGTSVDYIVS